MSAWIFSAILYHTVKNKINSKHKQISRRLVKHDNVAVLQINLDFSKTGGPGSSVGIATGYGLDGPGIESRWGRDFSAPVQTGPGAHPASCKMGTRSFPGVKERPGRDADSSSPSSAVVKKE